MSYAYGSASRPRFANFSGDLGISDKLAAAGKDTSFSRLMGGKPDLNTYAGEAPPKLSDEDRDAGYMWVNTGSHRFQTNDPQTGSTNHVTSVWTKTKLGGDQPAAKQEDKPAAAEAPDQPFTPSQDLLAARTEARERADAWLQGGASLPNLDPGSSNLYNEIQRFGSAQVEDTYKRRFLSSLAANAALQSAETDKASGYWLGQLDSNIKPPDVMSPEDILKYTKDYARFMKKA